MEQKEKMKALVERARQKDDAAWEELYKMISGPALFTIKQFVRDEMQAEDILQDTLLNAYLKLDTLKTSEQFKHWVVVSAANRAKDYLKKKNQPILFSELENDDFDEPLDFEDENLRFQPEAYMDMVETVELLLGMLEKLPQNQQLALAFHYGKIMNAQELAELMECSVNTVKGYCKYGIQNLRKQKDEMEAKGIKLRSVAIAPLLAWLYARETEALAASPEQISTILAAAQAGEAAATGASGTTTVTAASEIEGLGSAVTAAEGTAAAGSTAASAVGGFAFGKTLIGLGIAAALGGGAFVLQQNDKTDISKETNIVVEEPSASSVQNVDGAEDQLADLEKAVMELMEALDVTDRSAVRTFVSEDIVQQYYQNLDTDAVIYPSESAENAKVVYSNSGAYQGPVSNGKRTGVGEWFYDDENYFGEWSEDAPNGDGIWIKGVGDSSETTLQGSFIDGYPQGEIHYSYHGTEFLVNYDMGFQQEIESIPSEINGMFVIGVDSEGEVLYGCGLQERVGGIDRGFVTLDMLPTESSSEGADSVGWLVTEPETVENAEPESEPSVEFSDLDASFFFMPVTNSNNYVLRWEPSDTGDNVTGYYNEGGIYTGAAKEGMRSGEGEWVYPDPFTENFEERYVGAWKNNLPNGYGVKTSQYNDGNITEIVEGNFVNALAHGKMHMIRPHDNWDIYITCDMGYPQELQGDYPDTGKPSQEGFILVAWDENRQEGIYMSSRLCIGVQSAYSDKWYAGE